MRSKLGGELAGFVKTMAFALTLALVPRVVLCQPFTIPSGSMEPTLRVGDYVLVSKFAYGWSRHSAPFSPPLGEGRLMGREPHRGDIVVFKRPSDGRNDIIKRLVGLPGDRLQVVGGVLRLNGRPVERRAVSSLRAEGPSGETIRVSRFKETLPNGRSYLTNSYGPGTPAGNTGVYVVPAGCYVRRGDNRDNSLDSRFDPGEVAPGEARCPWNAELDRYLPPEEGMGFVPFDDLVGRADLILFSWNADASLARPWTAIRWDRLLHPLGRNVS